MKQHWEDGEERNVHEGAAGKQCKASTIKGAMDYINYRYKLQNIHMGGAKTWGCLCE